MHHLSPWRLALLAASLAPARVHAQARWTVDAKPVVDIAGTTASGDVIVQHAVAGTRLSDGTIVIADQGAASIKFFDASGKLLRSVGRRGRGPGEYVLIPWLGQCAVDTLFVWDYGQLRMTVISSNGELVRQYPLAGVQSARNSPWFLSCSRTGLLAYQPLEGSGARARPTPDSPVFRGTAAIFVGDATGNASGNIADVPGIEMASWGRGGGPAPLGKATTLAASRDRVYVGTSDSGSVDVYSRTGQRLTAISLSVPPRTPTRRNYERGVDEAVAPVNPAMRNEVRQAMLAMKMPERLPSYFALFLDPDDLLWVALSAPGDPDTRLRVVDAEGRSRGDVGIPRELRIFEIGRDFILGSYLDDNDEPHVAMYRLRRTP